jgi:hypothetical protein
MEKSPPPAGLVATAGGKIRTKRAAGVTTYSFHGLKAEQWRGKLSDGPQYREVFKDWMNELLKQPVHCLYLTGHHWDDHKAHRFLFLSHGDTTDYFHAEIDTQQQQVRLGTGRSSFLVGLETHKLRSECLLVLGFGCNVATGINTAKYQKFFRGGRYKPIIVGWAQSISVPPYNASDKRMVSKRFFDYLNSYAKQNSNVASKHRLKWFHQNEPMELVRAWGYATTFWYRNQARARDQNGKLYRFKYNKKTGVAEPVRA